MNNQARSTVGALARWLLSLAVVHLLAAIINAMLFSGMILENLENERFMDVYTSSFYFGIAVLVLFAIYYTTMLCRDVDMKNDIKEYMKEKNFTLFGFFIHKCLKMTLYRMIVYIAWQIPLVVMYLVMKLAPVFLTPAGKLWIVEAGAIGVTDSLVLGILINVLVLFTAYVLSLLIDIHFLHKDIKENSFT